jgi:hypothetical protein
MGGGGFRLLRSEGRRGGGVVLVGVFVRVGFVSRVMGV